MEGIAELLRKGGSLVHQAVGEGRKVLWRWCATALNPNCPFSVIFISPLQQPGAFGNPHHQRLCRTSRNAARVRDIVLPRAQLLSCYLFSLSAAFFIVYCSFFVQVGCLRDRPSIRRAILSRRVSTSEIRCRQRSQKSAVPRALRVVLPAYLLQQNNVARRRLDRHRRIGGAAAPVRGRRPEIRMVVLG